MKDIYFRVLEICNSIDFWVNVAPVIIILNIFSLNKLYQEDKKIRGGILFVILCYYIGAVSRNIADGYGNVIMAIVTLVFSILFLIFLLAFIPWWTPILKDLLLKLILILYIIIDIFIILYRLTYENILNIKFIYKIIGFDYINFLKNITANEWFKEISICVIGTVSGGLILDKIRNRKMEEKSFGDQQ